jgi:hypothetical protein
MINIGNFKQIFYIYLTAVNIARMYEIMLNKVFC